MQCCHPCAVYIVFLFLPTANTVATLELKGLAIEDEFTYNEQDGNVSVCVRLDPPPLSPITIIFTIATGTAGTQEHRLLIYSSG